MAAFLGGGDASIASGGLLICEMLFVIGEQSMIGGIINR